MSASLLRRDQVERYARHILLPDVGGIGQARLLAASVAVPVGPAGARENVALAYLAAAGVGQLVLVGDPHGPVQTDEICDGILLAPGDAGRARIDAITDRVVAINPDVTVVALDAATRPPRYTLASVPLASEPGEPVEHAPGHDDDAVADALIAGGLAAASTLFEIVSHEPA